MDLDKSEISETTCSSQFNEDGSSLHDIKFVSNHDSQSFVHLRVRKFRIDQFNASSEVNIDFKKSSSSVLQSEHSTIDSYVIILNIGGSIFETYYSTIRNHPETRLARDICNGIASYNDIIEKDEAEESKSGGDAAIYEKQFEFFYDRDPESFYVIINYYKTGDLHIPYHVCSPYFAIEMDFWGLETPIVQACCRGTCNTHLEVKEAMNSILKIQEEFTQCTIRDIPDIRFSFNESMFWQKVKRTTFSIYNQMVHPRPKTSLGRFFTIVPMLFLLFTLLISYLESWCRMRKVRKLYAYTQESSCGLQEADSLRNFIMKTEPNILLFVCYQIDFAYFFLEFAFRLLLSPCKFYFLSDIFHWLEVLPLAAHICHHIIYRYYTQNSDYSLIYLHLLELVRVVRVFRVVKSLEGINALFMSVKAGLTELKLVLIILITTILLGGATIFTVELVFNSSVCQINVVSSNSVDLEINNFWTGIWWAVVTLTQVGYGDNMPQTNGGYLIASFYISTSVVLVALPVPIISNNFSTYYEQIKYTHQKNQRNRRSLLTRFVSPRSYIDEVLKKEEIRVKYHTPINSKENKIEICSIPLGRQDIKSSQAQSSVD